MACSWWNEEAGERGLGAARSRGWWTAARQLVKVGRIAIDCAAVEKLGKENF
jgi:hypothetical protein